MDVSADVIYFACSFVILMSCIHRTSKEWTVKSTASEETRESFCVLSRPSMFQVPTRMSEGVNGRGVESAKAEVSTYPFPLWVNTCAMEGVLPCGCCWSSLVSDRCVGVRDVKEVV